MTKYKVVYTRRDNNGLDLRCDFYTGEGKRVLGRNAILEQLAEKYNSHVISIFAEEDPRVTKVNLDVEL